MPFINTFSETTFSKYGWVVGDSITKMSAPLFLDQYHPSFDVDAVNGRDINTLPGLVKKRLSFGAPRVMVLALGTNELNSLTRTQYVNTVDLIPDTTKVVLVSVWRDATIFGQERADNMEEISQWQKDLDKYRPNVGISSWRWTMLNGGAAQYISEDGVHPNDAGMQKWADLLEFAIHNSATYSGTTTPHPV